VTVVAVVSVVFSQFSGRRHSRAAFCNSCKKCHLDNKLGTPFNSL